MNCFCGMDERRKVLRSNSNQARYQSISSSQISSKPQVGFESAQNLIPGYFDKSFAVVINFKPRHMKAFFMLSYGNILIRSRDKIVIGIKNLNHLFIYEKTAVSYCDFSFMVKVFPPKLCFLRSFSKSTQCIIRPPRKQLPIQRPQRLMRSPKAFITTQNFTGFLMTPAELGQD